MPARNGSLTFNPLLALRDFSRQQKTENRIGKCTRTPFVVQFRIGDAAKAIIYTNTGSELPIQNSETADATSPTPAWSICPYLLDRPA